MADQFQAPPFRSEVIKDNEDVLKLNYFTPHWTNWILQVYKIIRFSGLPANFANNQPGLSVTITTAKLTGLGANGSMTFVNGILVAQTPAT